MLFNYECLGVLTCLPWQVHSSGAHGYIAKEILAENQLAIQFSRAPQGNLGQFLKNTQSHEEKLCFAICKELDKLYMEASDDNLGFNYASIKHLKIYLNEFLP